MHDTLFAIEQDLKTIVEVAFANPFLISVSDAKTMQEILVRVQNKAAKVRTALTITTA